MRKIILAIIFSGLLASSAFASEGMISIKSAHSVAVTGDRLENILQKKGMICVHFVGIKINLI